MAAIAVVETRAFEDPAFFDRMGLSEGEARLVRLPSSTRRFSANSRMDTFLTPDSFKFVEYNAESPAGIAYADVLQEQFLQLPIMQRFVERYGLTRLQCRQHVLDTLDSSGITDVYLLGRRGPAQATFTTKELKELGELLEADVIVDPADTELDAASLAAAEADRAVGRNVDVIREWSTRTPEGRPRRIHVRFLSRPIELKGDDRVRTVVVERTRLTPDGGAEGTGETEEIPADLVVRSVGYRGTQLDSLPFDERRNVIPHDEGRVLDGSSPVPGFYVAGWIKRGPTGIIGTNKKDAVATVASLLADRDAGRLPTPPRAGQFDALLAERGVVAVTTSGWDAIDAAERALGATRGRDRTTIHDRDELIRAAAG